MIQAKASPTATKHAQREMIRALEDDICFVDREEALWAFDADSVPGEFRYARAFEAVMDRLATPFEEREQLVGRLRFGLLPVPARSPERRNWLERVHSWLLFSPGHMTLDYGVVLREGLEGILQRSKNVAGGADAERSAVFAENAEICVAAIRRWIARYVDGSRHGMTGTEDPDLDERLAAFAQAPLRPARTFREGLQACWTVHLIMSGVVGGRDFGFGRLDQLLWPLMRADMEHGRLSEDQARDLLEDFCLKLNELAGNARGYPDEKGSHQPIPCTGTKQYIVLGGTSAGGESQANPLSFLFLDAVRAVRLREPVLHVRYDPEVDDAFRAAAVEASIATQGQVQFANEVFTVPALIRRGVPESDAREYGASACSRLDLGGTHGNGERWPVPVNWLLDYARSDEAHQATEFEVFLQGYLKRMSTEIASMVRGALPDAEPFYDTPFTNDGGHHFHLESLFLADCVDRKRHLCEGGGRYRLHLLCFVGLATVVNSLAAIRILVFEEACLSLSDFIRALDDNFVGHDDLRQRIVEDCPKFGNDDDGVDAVASRVTKAFLDAAEGVPTPPNHIVIGCFYSLIIHVWTGQKIGATFDGRLAGEPLSENQSAVYGTERQGTLGLLNSLSKLPFDRAVSGSLNLLFPANADAAKVRAILDAFFRKGGSMVGLTFADRAQLQDAMEHPGRYPYLQVRMHGFSEYFVNLPKEEQEEVLARTAG